MRFGYWVCLVLASSCLLLGESDSLGFVVKSDGCRPNSHSPKHGGRHICLFDNYEAVQGPYFFALLDQLMGETQHQRNNLAYFTSRTDHPVGEGTKGAWQGDSQLEDLKTSLDLNEAKLFLLDDWNPLTLEHELTASKPTIVWVQGTNAFRTRHLLRTSGLDRWLQEHCAPLHDTDSSSSNGGAVLFVGEGAGALCAGSDMAIATVRGDDPKVSPELQFYGLGLLGDDDDDCLVSFGVEQRTIEEHPRTSNRANKIQICRSEQVFVWSQSPMQKTANRFVMTPMRRGTIERYSTPDPWSDRRSRTQGDGGVPCYGEPAIDPSRSMQQIGDSEWIEEHSV